MRLLVQRVSSASVSVDDELVGRIGRGLVVLVGVCPADTPSIARNLAIKLAGLRIFPGAGGEFDLGLTETQLEALAVSQFTLYADTSRGRRPSFSLAQRADLAEPIFDCFVAELRQRVSNVATGRFGTEMQVELINDGPVTILIES